MNRTEDRVWGLNAAASMMAGAVIGGHYLAPSSAGSFGLAACIVGGIVGGWLLGYALTIALASVIGWKAVATLQLVTILALLAGMGGVAAAMLFEASVSSIIAVVCLTAVLHLPLLIVGLRRIKTIDFDSPTTDDGNNGDDSS